MTVLDDIVKKQLADLLKSLFSLFSCFGDAAVVSRAQGDFALDLSPKQLDWLNFRAKRRSVDKRMTSVMHELLHHCSIVIGMLLEPLLNCMLKIRLRGTAVANSGLKAMRGDHALG